jgi:isopentenyl-diphosphate Delta-isomerase
MELQPHELLDIVDLSGEPTGEQRDKAAIHAQGLWHRDVHVWITNGTDLLQQQRAWDKSIMPGQWDVSIGGHVGAGETYLQAAIRETTEEVGVTREATAFVPAGILAVDMAMGPTGWRHRTVGDNFVLVERDLAIAELAIQEEEVIDARWYPIDQLEADLANPETAMLHAEQPPELWALGIAAMRQAVTLK